MGGPVRVWAPVKGTREKGQRMQAEATELWIERYTGKGRLYKEPLVEGVELEMVEIPAGSFLMGSQEDEEGHQDRESPQHEVTVARFFMGRTPITQAQWRAVTQLKPVDENVELTAAPSNFEGDNRPVERVNWYETMEFCARLSTHTGRTYTLPSEAQWSTPVEQEQQLRFILEKQSQQT